MEATAWLRVIIILQRQRDGYRSRARVCIVQGRRKISGKRKYYRWITEAETIQAIINDISNGNNF